MLAELLLGQPIFPGDSGVDQLVEIIKVLGTPTREQIREMNPNYTEFKFPQIKYHPWSKVTYTDSCFKIEPSQNKHGMSGKRINKPHLYNQTNKNDGRPS